MGVQSTTLLGTSATWDNSVTTTDSNNWAQSNTVASGNGETVYGFKTQLSNSSIGSITTSDYGAVAMAFGLAKETVDSANNTYRAAQALDSQRANPLELFIKPALWIGGLLIFGFILLPLLFGGRRKKDEK